MPLTIGQPPESDFHNPLGMLSDCHRRIARFLEVLITIAETGRGAELDEEHREALDSALKYFREGAPKHTCDEEDSLFPRMRRRVGDSGARFALLTLLHADHVAVEKSHAQVNEIGNAYLSEGRLTPEDAERFTKLLHELRTAYQEHIEIEERRLFPFAARILTRVDLEEIGNEMAQRRGLAVHTAAS